MAVGLKIAPCLWFDTQGEEAAKFYVSIFKNSKITQVNRYPREGQEMHGKPEGAVLIVAFELEGQPFTALNAGPQFKFTEAVSFQVECDTQDEIDYYWDKLSEGGDPKAQQCSWLKDKYGLSWQIVPRIYHKLFADHKSPKSQKAFAAMLSMKKMDIKKLQEAYDQG